MTRETALRHWNRINRACLDRLEHTRDCNGWFACDCYVAKVEASLAALREHLRGRK